MEWQRVKNWVSLENSVVSNVLSFRPHEILFKPGVNKSIENILLGILCSISCCQQIFLNVDYFSVVEAFFYGKKDFFFCKNFKDFL